MQITPDGTIYSSGVPAGTYLLRVDGAAGWIAKSAMINGRDMLDTGVAIADKDMSGLVLTLTDRPSHVTGVVRDLLGKAADNATVLVFPGNGAWTTQLSAARRFGECRVGRNGDFLFTALPAGAYDIVAISDEQAGDWQDPAFLRRLSSAATHVTISEGQNFSIDLKIAVVR